MFCFAPQAMVAEEVRLMTFSEEEKRQEATRLELERRLNKIETLRHGKWEDAEERQGNLVDAADASAMKLLNVHKKLEGLLLQCENLESDMQRARSQG